MLHCHCKQISDTSNIHKMLLEVVRAPVALVGRVVGAGKQVGRSRAQSGNPVVAWPARCLLLPAPAWSRHQGHTKEGRQISKIKEDALAKTRGQPRDLEQEILQAKPTIESPKFSLYMGVGLVKYHVSSDYSWIDWK